MTIIQDASKEPVNAAKARAVAHQKLKQRRVALTVEMVITTLRNVGPKGQRIWKT